MQHISLLEEWLVGQQPIRYNRHENKLYIDMDWEIVSPGEYVVIECYMLMDPSVVPDVWKDRWLQDYTTALAKRQWGDNLSKYDAVLPSGLKLNGIKIRDDADRDVRRMEDNAHKTISMPLQVFMA